MIVVAKYGGIASLLSGDSYRSRSNAGFRTRYKYILQLKTAYKKGMIENEKLRKCESHVSLVMDTETDNTHKWIQLSYCGQDCTKLPPALWKMYGAKVHYLDLSYNSIETLKGLEQFARLEELILDNNKLGDGVGFPYLPHLRTLSLNNNQITDLDGLVYKISKSFPSLSYLSLLSNKACPNQLSDLDKDDSDYQRYRYFVIHKLRNLRFLDSRRVSTVERHEADARGQFMRVRRPPPPPTASAVGDTVQTRGGRAPARPLPVNLAALGKHKGAFGKCDYKYTGKHSEGNRFIGNSDL